MKNTHYIPLNVVLLNRLTQTVLDNLTNEQFGVEALAEEAGMSRSHLHRKLKAFHGKSISEFIRDVRLEEAMKLLQHDVATVSEVAYRVGFSSTSYFNSCFHAHYGYTPGEVKRQWQNNGKFPTDYKNDSSEQKTYGKQKEPSPPQPGLFNNQRKKLLKYPFSIKVLFGSVLALGLLFIIGISLFNFPNIADHTPYQEKSIAVLPFTSLSGEEDNKYFAAGIVEDLLNRLSRIEEFKVISSASSERYRDRGGKTIPQIAGELGVNYIIDGSVQRENNRARIHIQLIDAKKDEYKWSKIFDRKLEDIFKVQSEIALGIASELNTRLTSINAKALRKNPTENLRALNYYQLGRFFSDKSGVEDLKKSAKYFEKAIDEDPQFALAYAGLAEAYFYLLTGGGIKNKKTKEELRIRIGELTSKALDLDPQLSEVHGLISSLPEYLCKHEKREEKLLLALKYNPNSEIAHRRYAKLLIIMGRYEEARHHLDKAIELNPLSLRNRMYSQNLYAFQGNFKKALAEHKVALELNPDIHWTIWEDFLLNYHIGNEKAAFEAFKKRGEKFFLGNFDPDKAINIYKNYGLDSVIRWKPRVIGKSIIHIILGEEEKALDRWEKNLEVYPNFKLYPNIYRRYWYKKVYDNPRFVKIMKMADCPPPKSNPYFSYWYDNQDLSQLQQPSDFTKNLHRETKQIIFHLSEFNLIF